MSTAAETRQMGFYWVRFDRWVIAEFCGASRGDKSNYWFIPGEMFGRCDDELDEIDERRIERLPEMPVYRETQG